MNPDAERFIELATRPLGDNAELQLAAEAELRRSLDAHAADNPEAIKEAADSLASADRHPRRGRWRIWLLVATALVSLPTLLHSVWQFRQIAAIQSLFIPSLVPFHGSSRSLEEGFPHLDPRQKLLLFGASGARNESDKWKPLWDSEPENAAYLARYALASISDHDELSPEILAAAGRLDPDNAWFPALAAAGIAEGAVTKVRSSPTPKGGKKPTPVWKIDDEKRLHDALSAIHQLVGKSRFTGYQNELFRQRIPLFPPRRDFVSQIPPMVHVASQPSAGIRFLKLANVLAAGAQQCAANGDVAGFRQIAADWKFLAQAVVTGSENLVDGLVAKAMITSPLANFRDAAKALGLVEEAAYFAGLYDRAQEEGERRKIREAVETTVLATRRGSALASMTIPMLARQVLNPPVLTESDLRPGRYADHALFERLCTWPAWGLLGICAGAAALARYRDSPLARRLSARMVDLLRPSDWTWVVLGGVVFPVLWYFLVTRLTPLSGREWSGRMSMFIQPAGQFGCMALSMIILPVVIANWRLGRRGGILGLKKRFPGFGWGVGAIALSGVPIFGAVMLWETLGRRLEILAAFSTAVAGIWLLAGFALNVFGRASQSLRRATMARIVWPVWVFGMLVLVALVPFHYAQERRWIQQDEIYNVSADFPGPTPYEHHVTRILRTELLEMIGSSGAIH